MKEVRSFDKGKKKEDKNGNGGKREYKKCINSE